MVTEILLRWQVRNLGKPVELARRYSEEGADEVTFLNITSFRGDVIDAPICQCLQLTSEHVFVPLCIGGVWIAVRREGSGAGTCMLAGARVLRQRGTSRHARERAGEEEKSRECERVKACE